MQATKEPAIGYLVIPVIVAEDLQPCDGLPQRAAGRQPPAGMRTCCRAVEPVEEVGGGDHILITTPVDLLVQVTNNVNGQQLRRVVPDLQREARAVELAGDAVEVRHERTRPLAQTSDDRRVGARLAQHEKVAAQTDGDGRGEPLPHEAEQLFLHRTLSTERTCHGSTSTRIDASASTSASPRSRSGRQSLAKRTRRPSSSIPWP